jgi:D-sedoheptulose 7-phosphate isomerase
MTSLDGYVGTLAQIVRAAAVSDRSGQRVDLNQAVRRIGEAMRAAHDGGNKLMFVGNGGSAGICSHMAIDYSKNGDMRAMAFNDGAALTCLANDLGYDQVFAKQIDLHARPGDIVIAISSSGRSSNILRAVDKARQRECHIYTLSGFDSDNPLRSMGDLNIFLASHEYGFVEVGHLTLLHAVLDLQLGWNPTRQQSP